MSDESAERMEQVNKLTHLWWRVEALLERLKAIMTGTEIGTPKTVSDSSHSTDSSVHGSESAHVNINRIEISDRTLSVVAVVISAIALGMIFMLPAQQAARVDVATDRAAKAEREARVMQERWNDLKVELARKGIAVSDH